MGGELVADLTCPACAQPVTATAIVAALTICPACLSSLVLADGTCRRATGADTGPLTDGQLAQLRKQRAHLRKALEARG